MAGQLTQVALQPVLHHSGPGLQLFFMSAVPASFCLGTWGLFDRYCSLANSDSSGLLTFVLLRPILKLWQ